MTSSASLRLCVSALAVVFDYLVCSVVKMFSPHRY